VKAVRLTMLGVLFVLMAGCQVVRPPSGPYTFTISSFAWLPRNEGIIVAKDVGGEQQLWLVGARTWPRPLKPSEEAQFDPAVSPDGRFVAYAGYTPAGERFVALYERAANTTLKLDIDFSGAHPASPMFSPNGKLLAVQRVFGAADAHSDVEQDILLYDLGRRRTIGIVSQGDTNRLLGFSGASDRVYFWGTYDGHNHSWSFRYDLWEADVATLEAKRLSTGGPVRNAASGHLHPTMPLVVFDTWQAEDINFNIVPVPQDIYLAHRVPYSQTPLVSGMRASSPRFSPNGKQIAYVQKSPSPVGGVEVFLVERDGTNPRAVTANTWPKFAPQWSPDGRSIAFIQVLSEGRHALFVARADGKLLALLTPPSVRRR